MSPFTKRAGTYLTMAIIVAGTAASATAQGTAGSQPLSLPSGTQQMTAPQVASQPTGTTQAAAAEGKPEASEVLSTKGKLKLEISAMMGGGSKSIDLGTTTSGDAVKVSGGGGAGLAITAGYGLSEYLDFDVSLGGQASTERPAVENADASFSRGFLRASLKVLVPVRDRLRFKFGGGVGIYGGGELDVDTTRIVGGSRNIVKYDDATGAHLSGELEALIRNDFTVVAGLRLYSVKYKANSYEQNGVAQPVSTLRDDVRNLDGGGADFFIGLAKYF
ncbi:MAG: hypothetical protein AABZ15_07425 [Nitrospirota bacterium]